MPNPFPTHTIPQIFPQHTAKWQEVRGEKLIHQGKQPLDFPHSTLLQGAIPQGGGVTATRECNARLQYE